MNILFGINICSLTIQSLKRKSFRVILTSLGISIGVAAICVITAILDGYSSLLQKQFESMGSNIIVISNKRINDPIEKKIIDRINFYHMNILTIDLKNIKNISIRTPLSRFEQVRFSNTETYTSITGVNSDYANTLGYEMTSGRFISDIDSQYKHRVAVLGNDIVKQLNMPEDPTGKYIFLNGYGFQVIGLVKSKGQMLGLGQDSFILIPESMAEFLKNKKKQEINREIVLTVNKTNNINKVKDNIFDIYQKLSLISGKKMPIEISTSQGLISKVTSLSSSLRFVLIGIVSISLIVGGVSIMNTLFFSVTERTREIGLIKAVGANELTIVMMFLIESLLICLVGCVIGVALGLIIVKITDLYFSLLSGLYVPLWSMLLSTFFSIFVGIIFGLYPAISASKLNPIESLKYE